MIKNKSIFVSEEGKVNVYRYLSCKRRPECTLEKCLSLHAACPYYAVPTSVTDLFSKAIRGEA